MPNKDNIEGLDELIRKFKDYCQGNGDYDELDFKEDLIDKLKSQLSEEP